MKNALLFVVTLLLSLGAAEAALRIAGHAPTRFDPPAGGRWSEPDGHFGWRNRPGIFPSNEAGNVPMTFWPNRQRASRPDPVPPQGAPRVDVVGDSITQGYGVADSETYVWRLGEEMPGVDFENLGVGGYGTYQSLLVMEARAADPPKLTVYGFFGDHQYRNVAPLGWVRALRDPEGHNVVPPHVTPSTDGLVRHAGGAIPAWPLEMRLSLVTELHHAWERFVFRARGDMARPATERLVAAMADTAAKSGQKFLVMLLADAPDWLITELETRGIRYADCRKPEFERDPTLRLGGVGHPTAARHAAWAACLAPQVKAMLAQ
ncbi:MAG: hypothetical protein GC202_00870 [Alphaproteobacteria bacterium]|nr:hypothetical protein [Alphaproteobacteria bacterium]